MMGWRSTQANGPDGRIAAVRRTVEWVVDGPRAEEFQKLLETARRKGHATWREIGEVLREGEEDIDVLDEIFSFLEAHGISVHDDEEDVQKAQSLQRTVGIGGTGRHKGLLSGIPAEDTVSLYFREMSQEPLLSRQEEIELAQRIEQGRTAQQRLSTGEVDDEEGIGLDGRVEAGLEARARLIRANTRLVISIAKKYRGHGIPFLDLIQEGNLGLMKAVEKFDYRRGNRFSTYATWWIRQSVSRAVPAQGRTMRIPTAVMQRIRRVYKTSGLLEQELGRRPTIEEIAEELDMAPRRVQRTIEASYYPISLEKPVGEDEDSVLGDFVANEHVDPPTVPAEQSLLARQIEQALETLTPREARILRLRFGLQDGHCYTLKEVGERFGLTKERIRQIQHHALQRLRHPRRFRLLRGYV
jgi:RNA polymerase primary sigma factor